MSGRLLALAALAALALGARPGAALAQRAATAQEAAVRIDQFAVPG
jgi:hypothetical protein